MPKIAPAICAALALSACAGHRSGEPHPLAGATANWRLLATDADRDRLRGWRDAWMAALPEARAADSQAVKAHPDLFDPDRRLDGALPPPGEYRCRTFKLGVSGTATSGFTAYPAYPCRIERNGDATSFVQTNGPQRATGTILDDRGDRAVFLGTLSLGDERRPLAYGRDAKRDMAGFVERIDENRWRLTLPSPSFQSKLAVIEIIRGR